MMWRLQCTSSGEQNPMNLANVEKGRSFARTTDHGSRGSASGALASQVEQSGNGTMKPEAAAAAGLTDVMCDD